MKKILVLLTSTLFCATLNAQSVPNKMMFGNLKITIKTGAKVIMQENVNALTKSKPYFATIVERANTYFPIIEKRLKEVGVPDDIKYLCIQESSLIADAVSSSNAVGYWQFKKATAQEVGLTVNKGIDERKNIAAASTGAAIYIKKHNKSLDNWAYSLLAYNTGLGGVQKHINKKHIGTKHMTVDKKTHWYLLKFLSHKIAFEQAIKKKNPEIALIENNKVSGETMASLAKSNNLDSDDVKFYNRWIDFNKSIPNDKIYVAILPVPYGKKKGFNRNDSKELASTPTLIDVIFGGEEVNLKELPSTFTVNGVKVIIPKATDTYTDLAYKGGITVEDLLAFNEISADQEIDQNSFYFLKKKKKKALVNFHPAEAGETIHSISQLFGVTSNSILKKNRMDAATELKTGRILWLRKTRKKSTAVEYGEIALSEEEKPTLKPKGLENFPVFNGKSPDATSLPTSTVPEVIVPVTKQLPTAVEIREKPILDTSTVPIQEIEDNLLLPVEELVVPNEPILTPTLTLPEGDISIDMSGDIEGEVIEKRKIITEFDDNIEILEDEIAISENIAPNNKKEVTTPFTVHTVKKSETVYSISKQYNTKVKQLLEWNKLTDYNLSIGQELKIFDKKTRYIPKKSATPTHKVIKGDTFYSISKKYGLSVDELKKLNNKTDLSLSIGEEVIVK